jgi:RNA polymerase sigma-70 factor, ECF subfamily
VNDQETISRIDVSEEDILRRSQTDPQAFKPIYEKYYKKVFLFVYRKVGEKELAADIAQQTFLKGLMALSKFQFRGVPFSAWLFRIALNECNEFFRKSKRARWIALDDGITHLLHEELTYDTTQDDLTTKLPALLAKLKEDELQLIQLRFFEGLAFKEISEILDMTENNTKVKTYRTLEKLKKEFLKQ